MTLVSTAVGVVAFGVMVGIAYATTDVPSENDLQKLASQQASEIKFADGKLLAKVGTDRTPVPLKQIPQHVRDAVIALENRDFYTEPGISVRGMFRALWSTVSGEQVQGASTITQQYVRNYYDIEGISKDDRSMSRKLKEIFVSLKVDDSLEKDEILKRYLNTISFGRNTYGIEAAARTYYRKSAKDLTPQEGAFLAGLIQNPARGDVDKPHEVPALRERYHESLRVMAETRPELYGKYAGAPVPKAKKPQNKNYNKGVNGYIIDAAIDELKREYNITKEEMGRRGLRIETTVNQELMRHARDAVHETMKANGLPKRVKGTLAAVNPKTGAIEAFYGGPGYIKQQWNNAFDSQKQAGSAFKPYVLAAWLDRGWSLRSLVDGPKSITVEGNKPINNAGNRAYGTVDLYKATQNSINTAYVQASEEVGRDNVAEMAIKLGLSKKRINANKDKAILAIGSAEVTAVQQAGGFAMFANNGNFIKPHLIKSVNLADGMPYTKKEHKPVRVLEEGMAADATDAMRRVVRYGTGRAAALPGRPVAGKTGTTDESKEAWFAGYTPQMSTAVGIYGQKDKKNGDTVELKLDNIRPGLSGGSVPAAIWRNFMIKAHEGKPVEPFPAPQNVGEDHNLAEPDPEPTEDPSEDPWPSDPPDNKDKCQWRPWHPDCQDDESPPPGEPQPSPPPGHDDPPIDDDPGWNGGGTRQNAVVPRRADRGGPR